jgi:hypothetical protein
LKNETIYNQVFRSYIDESLSKRECAALQGNSHLVKCTKGNPIFICDSLTKANKNKNTIKELINNPNSKTGDSIKPTERIVIEK